MVLVICGSARVVKAGSENRQESSQVHTTDGTTSQQYLQAKQHARQHTLLLPSASSVHWKRFVALSAWWQVTKAQQSQSLRAKSSRSGLMALALSAWAQCPVLPQCTCFHKDHIAPSVAIPKQERSHWQNRLTTCAHGQRFAVLAPLRSVWLWQRQSTKELRTWSGQSQPAMLPAKI
eukprot:2735707-Amphidinium_carterae.2